MPFATIDGVRLFYEIVGRSGPWVVLSPGGRRSLDEMRGLASIVARNNCRVLLHDRRNTGRSDLAFDGSRSEFEAWADDAEALMHDIGTGPAVLAGASSGCRMAILLALRHPKSVRGLFLMRPTGGAFAVKRLAHRYYTIFIDAAERGGMEEVCRTDHFQDLVQTDPTRADILTALDPAQFIAVMLRWRANLEEGLNQPILGASEQELRGLEIPACVIPGNDNTHSRDTGLLLHRLLPNAELRELETQQRDVDIVSMQDWVPDDKLGEVLTDFMR